MSSDNNRFYLIDPNIDDHRSFFDHDWARTFMDDADRKSISEIALNLCESWKGAANMARMPWLSVEMLESNTRGFLQRRPYASHFLNLLVANLGSGITPPLAPPQIESMTNKAAVLDRQLCQSIESSPLPFNRQGCMG